MFERYFKEVSIQEAAAILKKTPLSPGFLIRRSRAERTIIQDEKEEYHTIYSDDPKNPPVKQPLYYSISYVANGSSFDNLKIKHIRFCTYEINPKKLNEKFEKLAEKYFQDVNVIKTALDLAKSETIVEKKRENSVFISIHQDRKLRPEEISKVQSILVPKPEDKSHGALIISMQTPTKDILSKGVSAGKTGLELEKILKDSHLDRTWIIITGHGEVAGDVVSGDYTPLFPVNIKLDVEMSPVDYVRLLVQGGLKSGDDVNIILNICYSGARQEQMSKTGKLRPINGSSFAEKFAIELARRKIASYIVASKSTVIRFGGEYFPAAGEEKDQTMIYRVKGGPADICVVRTTIEKVITKDSIPQIKYKMDMIEGFKDNFFISKKGIGFPQNLEKDLCADFAKTTLTKNPGREF